MAIADAHDLPISVCIAIASPHEVTLVEQTVDSSFLGNALTRIIGDRAYDSDPLDEQRLKERGVEMISPHRPSRRRPPAATLPKAMENRATVPMAPKLSSPRDSR